MIGYTGEAYVRDWAGIDTGYGRAGNQSLTTLNDEGKSFEEIADVIEKHWETL